MSDEDDAELAAIRAKLAKDILAAATAAGAAASAGDVPKAVPAPRRDEPFPATDADLDTVIRGNPAVLVDLWAPWCGPCRAVAPVMERVAKERAGRLAVAKVNVDENPAISQRFGVRSIPTLLLFKAGRLVDQVVGAMPKPQVDQWLRRHGV